MLQQHLAEAAGRVLTHSSVGENMRPFCKFDNYAQRRIPAYLVIKTAFTLSNPINGCDYPRRYRKTKCKLRESQFFVSATWRLTSHGTLLMPELSGWAYPAYSRYLGNCFLRSCFLSVFVLTGLLQDVQYCVILLFNRTKKPLFD
jgi:hypothetical protein